MSAQAPLDKVDRACLWIRDNPALFRKIMHLAHIEAERGNTCFQRDNIYDAARRCGFAITDSRELRRDHNLYSVLARYMVMLRPKLARCINFRKSDVDDVDLVERWHELVNPQTTFLAESWREAKKAVELEDVSAA